MEIKDNRGKKEGECGKEGQRRKGGRERSDRSTRPPAFSQSAISLSLVRLPPPLTLHLSPKRFKEKRLNIALFQENGIEIAFDRINRIIWWRNQTHSFDNGL